MYMEVEFDEHNCIISLRVEVIHAASKWNFECE